jgi:hypothetical protein
VPAVREFGMCAVNKSEVIAHFAPYFTDWQDYGFLRCNAM